MDLPEHFGSWKGAHNRPRKWAADGTGEKVFTALLAQADIEGDVASIGAVDSTVVRAHQHAAEARPKGIPPHEPDDHALERRPAGGLTIKLHLFADSHYRPLAVLHASSASMRSATAHGPGSRPSCLRRPRAYRSWPSRQPSEG